MDYIEFEVEAGTKDSEELVFPEKLNDDFVDDSVQEPGTSPSF